MKLIKTPLLALAIASPMAVVASAHAEVAGSHNTGVATDPAAIESTRKLGDRSYSPYANRPFPVRPLWGDQHVHTSWSFDAGLVCTIGVEEALRFARGEQVESTFGVPVKLSRPLDWIVMTDHSDSLGFTSAIRAGNKELMTDELLQGWNKAMNSGDLQQIVPVAMDAIQRQGKGTLPEVAMDPAFLLQKPTQSRFGIVSVGAAQRKRFANRLRFTGQSGWVSGKLEFWESATPPPPDSEPVTRPGLRTPNTPLLLQSSNLWTNPAWGMAKVMGPSGDAPRSTQVGDGIRTQPVSA